ncbi:MAG TPA: hypothetical protein VIK55_07805 [Paludibacter sp.]
MKKINIEKVTIDPRARIVYASYFIQGLYDIYGKKNVYFSLTPFIQLEQLNDNEAFDQYFAFVIKSNDRIKRVVIDYRDKTSINESAYNWCDIYGKVNLSTIEKRDKIYAIGPNFGVKLWSKPISILYCLINYLKSYKLIHVNFRYFMSGYNWQMKRNILSTYNKSHSDQKYVFFVSSLWPNDNTYQNTNQLRAMFIRSCKSLSLNFIGGFYAKKTNPQYEIYKDLMITDYVDPDQYLSNIKKSAFVFNTPAVHYCHGWKLGEFFALGKAIISTPLSNEMPSKVEHGKNIHFVNNEEELRQAILKITNDDKYRLVLEQGALSYYNKYLKPSALIERLLNKPELT